MFSVIKEKRISLLYQHFFPAGSRGHKIQRGRDMREKRIIKILLEAGAARQKMRIAFCASKASGSIQGRLLVSSKS